MKEMPFFTQPYHRLKKKGASALGDDELLAIIIRSGLKGENARDTANKLLKEYNLNKLGQCSLTELKKILKDEVKALRIMALSELIRRHNRLTKGGLNEKTIESAQDVYNYFVDKLKDKKKEHFYVLFLDSKNKLISEDLISVGTLNSSIVHPREVFNNAIRENANSIILVHNHPSGNPQPSEEDKEITELLVKAGELLSIKVLDHVIIGREKWYSFDLQ